MLPKAVSGDNYPHISLQMSERVSHWQFGNNFHVITFLIFTLAWEVGQNIGVQNQGKDRELLYLMFTLI